MQSKLTADERSQLITQHRQNRDRKECDRIKAVLAYDEGYSYSEIARLLLLDDQTIRRHVADYFNQQKLTNANGGSQSHLRIDWACALKQHLQEHVYRQVKAICVYVKQTYGVSYSISGMTYWLHAQGFCYKKPQGAPAKVDKAKQATFIAEYAHLKVEAAKRQEAIYFLDSTHPQHQTHLAYGWIVKGESKRLATTAKHYRLSVIGGLCLEGHKVVYQPSDSVDAQRMQAFLKKLRKGHEPAQRLHVILDNAGYHHSKAVTSYAQDLNIQLHYLPAYSPNLNPIERLWKIMHEQVSYNRYYEKFAEFKEATLLFFRHIGKKKKLLRARINDNFQQVDAPNFAF